MTVYLLSRTLSSMGSSIGRDESGAQVHGAKHHPGLSSGHWDPPDASGAEAKQRDRNK
ncbi:MAG: hypothetical protein RLZ55_1167 [Actinomycetota bacterium]|jgi:hypothetical protein